MSSTSEQMRWDQRYRAGEILFGEEPSLFLREQAFRFTPGMKALAVADGQGRNGVWLASQGLDVLSVDISETGLQLARELAARRRAANSISLSRFQFTFLARFEGRYIEIYRMP